MKLGLLQTLRHRGLQAVEGYRRSVSLRVHDDGGLPWRGSMAVLLRFVSKFVRTACVQPSLAAWAGRRFGNDAEMDSICNTTYGCPLWSRDPSLSSCYVPSRHTPILLRASW